MKRAAQRPTFILCLRPEAYVNDPVKMLRWALKALLRKYGLRCVSVRPGSCRPSGPPRAKEGKPQ
jgi:hypothetical protein